MTSSNNKYKNQVLRLSDMLQSTFQEVQYYKKRDADSQATIEKLKSQNDKLKEDNFRLTAEREYLQNQSHLSPQDEYRRKSDHDNSTALNKGKLYMEKVSEIIKAMAEQIKNRKKSRHTASEESQNNLLVLEKSFAKASMGVLKYQQQFMKHAVDKESMRIQLDKLRKENTNLFQMTSTLQQNFGEADRIVKKYNQENKKMIETIQNLQFANENMRKQLENKNQQSRLNSRRKQNRISDNNNNHELDHLYQEKLYELQAKIKDLEEQIERMREGKSKQKDAYSFRQKSESSEFIGEIQQDRKLLNIKNKELSEEIKKLNQELHACSDKIRRLEKQGRMMADRKNRFADRDEGGERVGQGDNDGEGDGFPEEYYQIKIEELQKTLQNKNQQIEDLLSQIESSEVEKDKIITVYENESHQSKDKILRHQDALMQMQKLIKSLKSRNQQLLKSNRNLLKENVDKEALLEKTTQKLAHQQQTKTQHELLIKQLKEDLNHKKLQKQLGLSESDININIDSNQNQIKNLQETVRTLMKEKEKLEMELERNEGKMREHISKLNKDNQKIDMKYNDVLKKCQVMQDDLDERKNQLLQLEGNIRGINKVLNQMVETWGVDDTEQLLTTLNQKLEKQSQLISELTVKSQKSEKTQKTLQSNLCQEKTILSLENKALRETTQLIIDQIVQIFKIRGVTNSTSYENWSMVKQHLVDYEQAIEKERQKMEELEAGWWQKENSMSQQIKDLKEGLARVNRDKEGVDIFDNEKLEESRIRQIEENKNERIAELEEELSLFHKNLSMEKLKNEKLQKNYSQKQEKLHNMSQNLIKISQELSAKQQSLENLQRKYEEKNQEIEKLKSQRKQLQQTLEQQQIGNDEQYRNIQDDTFQLRQDLDKMRLSLIEQKNVSDCFREKIGSLTEYIQQMRKNAGKAVQKMREQFDKYEKEIEHFISNEMKVIWSFIQQEVAESCSKVYYLFKDTKMKKMEEKSKNSKNQTNLMDQLLFGDDSEIIKEGNRKECDDESEEQKKLIQKIVDKSIEQQNYHQIHQQIVYQKQIESLPQKLLQKENLYHEQLKENRKYKEIIRNMEEINEQREREYLKDLQKLSKEKRKFEEELKNQQVSIESFHRRENEFVRNQQRRVEELMEESSRDAQRWKREKEKDVEDVLSKSIKQIEKANTGLWETVLEKLNNLESKYSHIDSEISGIKLKFRDKNGMIETKMKQSFQLKDATIQQKDTTIKSKQIKIDEQSKTIYQLQKQITALTFEMKKQQQSKKYLQQKIQIKDRQIANKKQEISQFEKKENEFSRELEKMNVILEEHEKRERSRFQEMNAFKQKQLLMKNERNQYALSLQLKNQQQGIKIMELQTGLEDLKREMKNIQILLHDKDEEISLLRASLEEFEQKDQIIASLRAQIQTQSSKSFKRRLAFTTSHQQSFSLKPSRKQSEQEEEEQSETRIKQFKTTSPKRETSTFQLNNQETVKNIQELKMQIEEKQAKLLQKEHYVNQRIDILKSIEEKLSEQRSQMSENADSPSKTRIYSEDIRRNTPSEFKKQKLKIISSFENQFPLQINLKQQTKNAGQFSMRTRKQEQMSKDLQISEQLRQILENQNNNLKREIARKDKQVIKIKDLEKAVSQYVKENEKLSAELKMKEKIISKYDLEIRRKSEQLFKMTKSAQNLREQLELEKKRNKNFEDLYEKYRMQKKVMPSVVEP